MKISSPKVLGMGSRKQTLMAGIILMVIITISVVVRLRLMTEPLDRDEGWYAYIGQEILRGSLPYRDLTELKPPGGFYLYSLGVALFGPTVYGIRLYSLLFSMANIVGVFFVARQIAGVAAGLWGALCLAILSATPLMLGGTSNLETFLILPLLAAVWFHLRKATPGPSELICSGTCIGIALLIKPVALPFALLLAIFSFGTMPDREIGKRFRALGWYIMAIIAVSCVSMVWMAYLGVFADFLHFNVVVPYMYVTKDIFTGPSLAFLLSYLAPELLLGSIISIPAALYFLLHKRCHGELLAVLLIPAAWAAVLLPGKNFPHYAVVLMPFLAIMTGIALGELSRIQGVRRYAGYCTFLLALVLYCLKVYPFYFVMTPRELSIYKYGTTFVQSDVVAEYLRSRLKPGEPFLQWGFAPELYFQTSTRAPLPISMSTTPIFMRNPRQSVTDMMAKLTANPPRYIAYDPQWADFPGVEQIRVLILTFYVREIEIPPTIIFRRRDIVPIDQQKQ